MSLLTDVTESMRNSLFEGIVADRLDEEIETEKALESSCGKEDVCPDVELTDDELAELLLEEDLEEEEYLAIESDTGAVVCEDDDCDDENDDIDEDDLDDEAEDDITDALDGIEDSMEFDADED